jgi:hypothetical protein
MNTNPLYNLPANLEGLSDSQIAAVAAAIDQGLGEIADGKGTMIVSDADRANFLARIENRARALHPHIYKLANRDR